MGMDINPEKEFIITRKDGSTETVKACSAMVGRAGELEFLRYDEYKADTTFHGWYLHRVMAPGSWTDLVQVKEKASEQVPKGQVVRVYDNKDPGKGGVRDLS